MKLGGDVRGADAAVWREAASVPQLPDLQPEVARFFRQLR